MRHPGLFVLILLLTSLLARQLRAESTLVVLVRPPAQDAIVSEAINRIRGELIADGFEVSVVDAPSFADRGLVLARADQQTNAAATLGLFLQADAKAAELWVIDRLTNKTVVRSVEMAAQVLTGFGDVGAAVMPVGRVRVELGSRFVARVTLSGLGTRPRVESAEGSATVSQTLGLFELLGEIAPRARLKPTISLGAGGYHVGVDGSASFPYAGLTASRLVFAADTGAGLALAMTPSFALSLEGHATLVTPHPVLRFLEGETAKLSNPLLSAALTLVGRL